MRKLKIIEHISLDGVIQHSADGGDFAYSAEASICCSAAAPTIAAHIRARQHESDADRHHLQFLQGRGAFE